MEENVRQKELEKSILDALNSPAALAAAVAEVHAEDLAGIIEELRDEDRIKVIEAAGPELASEIFLHLSDERLDAIIKQMDARQLSGIVQEMESDDATDFVAELPQEVAEEVLQALPAEDSAEVRELLKYPENTAGGLMQLELIALEEGRSCQDAIDLIRAKMEEVPDIHFVFVTDAGDRLVGVVPLKRLLLNPPNTRLADIMDRDPEAIPVTHSEDDVAQAFRKYDIVALPVVDADGRLLGRIMHDDILDLVTETATEDMMRVAGTDEEELEYTGLLRSIRYRLPWLISSMLGGLFMAGIIGGLGAPAQYAIALASFIPVITGMGGNVSTQSSAIVVRGLALGEITAGDILRIVYKELRVGVSMAIICGTLLGTAAMLFNHTPAIGAVVAASLFCSMGWAALLGTSIPLALDKLKMDPALGAGPLVLTIADISGLTIYFTLANALLAKIG